MRDDITPYARQYLGQLQALLNGFSMESLTSVIRLLIAAYGEDKTVYILGNGGSAATASHFACDLGKGTASEGRRRFRVMSLTDNTPFITAAANDLGYEQIFVEQLRGLLQPGDVVIAISASGNSPNVVRAIEYAKERGAVTIGVLGFDGGKSKLLVDACIHVPSFDYGLVEDCHLIAEHMLTQFLAGEMRRLTTGDTSTR